VIIPVSLPVIIPVMSGGKTLEMNEIFGFCALVFGMLYGIHMSVGKKEKTRKKESIDRRKT